MSATTGAQTVALSTEEQAAIEKARQRAGGGKERRRHARLPLDERFPLLMRLETSGATFIAVRPRDLSSSGLGFFHVAYVHPGTSAVFIMKGRKGEVATIKGTVTRCAHVSGRVHEVGAVFEQEIQVEVFVSQPAATAAHSPADEVYKQVAAMAEQLKALAAERAAFDSILDRVGKLALLVTPREAEKPKGDAPAPSGH